MKEIKKDYRNEDDCVQIKQNGDIQAVHADCSFLAGEEFDAFCEKFLQCKELHDELEKNQYSSDSLDIKQLVSKKLDEKNQTGISEMQKFLAFFENLGENEWGDFFIHVLAVGIKSGIQIERQATKLNRSQLRECTQKSDQNLEPNTNRRRIQPYSGESLNTEINPQKGEKKFIDKAFDVLSTNVTDLIHKPKGANQARIYSNQHILTVIYAKNLENNLQDDQEISRESVENIISKARYMKAFATQQQGEEVFNGFRLSDEGIDYTQSINVVLLIEVSGTDDLLEAKNPYEFKNRLNPVLSTAIVRGIRRLASIEGVSNQLHRLV